MGVSIGPSHHRSLGLSAEHAQAATSHRAKIELRIDELILHGFSAGDRRRIGDAVEMELQRLLAQGGLPALLQETSTTERLDAGTFKVVGGAKPESVGAQLARTVTGGLVRHRGQER